MADVKISNLPLLAEILGSLKIPTGKAGDATTKAFTIEMLVTYLSLVFEGNNPKVLTGTVNPDNAVGNNGDIYFKTSETAVVISQKLNDVWSEKVTITLKPLSEANKVISLAEVTSHTIADWQTNYAGINAPTFTVLVKDPDGDNVNKYRIVAGIQPDYVYEGSLLQSVTFELGPVIKDYKILIHP